MGLLLASSSADSTIKIWNLYTGKEQRTLSGHSDSVNAIGFSKAEAIPNNLGKTHFLVSGSGDGTLKIWGVR
jgi:WD40 repeat protein